MSDGRFNCVAILDAIPEGELNTARRLREDLDDIACYVAKGLEVRYFKIQTTYDLYSAISSLKLEAEKNGLVPWLHLEGHGAPDESGFATADASYCSWDHLKNLVTSLNVATNLNVVIVLATCYGGSFTKAITTIDRAPVLGVIGPTREITIGEVEIDFPEFYKTFFETGSLKKGIAALTSRASPDLYYRTTAEQFFYDVWASYKTNECSEDQINRRARRMYRKAKDEGVSPTPSVGQIKRRLRSEEKGLFEKYRDKYFMYDISSANQSRFPVTYKDAEKHASH